MIIKLNLTVLISLLLTAMSCNFNSAQAHEFRPGHLQLIEVDEGTTKYHVIWKKPILLNTTVQLDPVFPEDC